MGNASGVARNSRSNTEPESEVRSNVVKAQSTSTMTTILQLLLACILALISYSSAFTTPSKKKHQKFKLYTTHYPTDLDTAYEWIANIRQDQDPSSIPITWFHPHDTVATTNPFHLEDVETTCQHGWRKMPLYPLGAVHVPYCCGNYTLNSVQERNVVMARVSDV